VSRRRPLCRSLVLENILGLRVQGRGKCPGRSALTHPMAGPWMVILPPKVRIRSSPWSHSVYYASVEGMAPPVRTLARAKTTWRVVEPPRRVVGPTGPFPTQDLRPRVWAGVRRRPPRRKLSGVDLLCGRVKMSCLLRSPPLQKIMAALLGKIYALHSFFLRRNVTPASGGGRMMSGRAGKSPSQCKHCQLPASKSFPGRRGSS
jgi:hypothetical protein